MRIVTMRLLLIAGAGLSVAAATPASRTAPLPPPLLPLSDADTTTGESGCESYFTQGAKSFVYVQNSNLILRTAPGAGGRQLCHLTQAQQEGFGSGPTTVTCGDRRLAIRPTGRGTAHPEADSSESPAALTLGDGTHSRVIAGRYGTAC